MHIERIKEKLNIRIVQLLPKRYYLGGSIIFELSRIEQHTWMFGLLKYKIYIPLANIFVDRDNREYITIVETTIQHENEVVKILKLLEKEGIPTSRLHIYPNTYKLHNW